MVTFMLAAILIGFGAAGALAAHRPAPSGVGHSVSHSWRASVDAKQEEIIYNVYRLSGACPRKLPNVPRFEKFASGLVETAYTDSSISALGDYCYYVTAVSRTGGESVPSQTAQGVVPSAAPEWRV